MNDANGNDMALSALRRAAGLAGSARARPGESFLAGFDKSVIGAVTAYLRRDRFIVRVAPHGMNPTDMSSLSVTWPKHQESGQPKEAVSFQLSANGKSEESLLAES